MTEETGPAARANGTGPLATAAAKVNPLLSRVEMKARREATRLAGLSFAQLPPAQAVRMVYNVLLRREPDPTGWTDLTTAMAAGQLNEER